ncbi:MAG TPA: hypothetical protein VIN10_02155, partial [Bacteroidales bacterium]
MKHALLIFTFFIAIFFNAISQSSLPGEVGQDGFLLKNKLERATVQVTFQVNMSNEEVSTDGVHLAGSWQGDENVWTWDPSAILMVDLDGDDIYTASVDLESGTEYYFLFFNGDEFGTQEDVPAECEDVNTGTRFFTPGTSDVTLDPLCFSYCINCAPFYDITLEVNMQYESVSPDGVFVVGTFTDNITGSEMTSSDNVVFTTTVSLMEGSQARYRFVNGDPVLGGDIESWSVPYPPCVGGEPQERILDVPSANTTFAVCFEYCANCPNLLISEIASPSDNPWSGFFIELYNAGSETVDFDELPIWLLQYSPVFQWNERLSGSLAAGEKFVVGSPDFEDVYGFAPNLASYDIYGNGDDAFFLYMGNVDGWQTQIDAFGSVDEFGDPTTIDFVDTKAVRLRDVTEPSPVYLPAQWHFPITASVDDMTPAAHSENVDWTGNLGTDWNTKGNWDGLYGYIPDASFNVNIPNMGNDPSISAET